jgi:chromate reductase
MTKIAVFVGSIRAESVNMKLARALEAHRPEGTEFVYVDITGIPLFNQDHESNPPQEVQTMKDTIEQADGVLFVTPEYNRSIPGVLKNAIDWVSRPYGNNSLAGKPAAVTGASGGSLGTALAQAHLRTILLYLDTTLMGQPELYFGHVMQQFDDAGAVTDPGKVEHLQKYMKAFTTWIDTKK